MNMARKIVLAATITLPMLAALPAYADTTVSVSLWDTPNMVMSMGFGHGMMGNMSMATMGVTTSLTSVPAGEVTFNVTNDSADAIHELIIAPLSVDDELLPYLQAESRVDEDAAHSIGEVPELDPGKSGAATFNLAPGSYILYCNIPGHYMSGMWTTIQVK